MKSETFWIISLLLLILPVLASIPILLFTAPLYLWNLPILLLTIAVSLPWPIAFALFIMKNKVGRYLTMFLSGVFLILPILIMIYPRVLGEASSSQSAGMAGLVIYYFFPIVILYSAVLFLCVWKSKPVFETKK